MKVIKGVVNDVSDSLKPKKLQKGETVIYQLLTGHANPIREERATRPFIFPFSNEIPSTDRIWDAKKKNEDGSEGSFVDIALVQSVDKDKNVQARRITIFGSSTRGMFSCTAGVNADEELYEFLELTNRNKSNPNRDESYEPLFERVDVVENSKEKSKRRSVLREALTYAQNLTNGDVKELAASLGWSENDPVEILRDKIEEFAEKTPDKFVQAIQSKDRDIKATIKRAIDAGVIHYNPQEHKLVHAANNQTLIKMDRVEGADYLAQAADYVLHNKNGQKVFDTIKKLLQPSNATV